MVHFIFPEEKCLKRSFKEVGIILDKQECSVTAGPSQTGRKSLCRKVTKDIFDLDQRQNTGLLGNESAIVETGGGNGQTFLFELDDDKSPLNKNLTTVQQAGFSELLHNRLQCLPKIFEFQVSLEAFIFLFIKSRYLSYNDIYFSIPKELY